MTFPVRVVIPTIPSRTDFLTSKCLPSVVANDPAEIVVVSDAGGAQEKRNRGAAGTIQPYLLFVDDDSTLLPGCISTMVEAIELYQTAFVYSDFDQICLVKSECSRNESERFTCGPFAMKKLLKDNYINTTSLVRTSRFPGFDPEIKRYQDWDLWLTIVRAGEGGTYINKVLFQLWHIDQSISDVVPEKEARLAIVGKHNLP